LEGATYEIVVSQSIMDLLLQDSRYQLIGSIYDFNFKKTED
jgi:hypothetical protein